MIFVVNPQPPYDQDWNGWGPRLAVDYALANHTVLHAGGAITTGLMNLWQENFLNGLNPVSVQSLYHRAAGHCGPVPEQVAVIPLPPAYDICRQPHLSQWAEHRRQAQHGDGPPALPG